MQEIKKFLVPKASHRLPTDRFYYQASKILASSFDFEKTLSSIAKLAVEGICDWCAIDALNESGNPQRLAIAANSEKILDAIPEEQSQHFSEVVQTGKVKITDSMAIMPMQAWNDVFGTITFGYKHPAKSKLRVNPEMEELSACAAMAIENAKLFSNARQQSLLLENVSDAVISTDGRSRINSWNKGAELLYQWTASEAKGQNIFEFLQIEFSDPYDRQSMLKELVDKGQWHGEISQKRKDGRAVRVFSSMSYFKYGLGQSIRAVSINRDITERHKAEELIRKSEQRFRALIERSASGIILIDAEGKVLSMGSPILGYKIEDWMDQNIFKAVYPDDLPVIQDKMAFLLSLNEQQLADPNINNVHMECQVRDKTGKWHWVEFTATNLLHDPDIQAMVVNYKDIHDKKAADNLIRYQATHDPMTGLPNREALGSELVKVMQKASEEHELAAVLYLDLDRFKNINNLWGHSVGDALICEFTKRVRQAFRKDEIIARIAGDEFVVVLPNMRLVSEAIELANRILEVCAEPIIVDKKIIHVTTSIGIALYPNEGQDVEQLLSNAHTALHRAKEFGRNRYQLYNHGMEMEMANKFTLEADMRNALKNGEFVLYYQPIVDTMTNTLVAAEALVRWNHPRLGFLPPKNFIGIAEESGLIFPLGEWILKQACIQKKAWEDSGLPPFRVAVNISARQFSEPHLVQMIKKTLRDADLQPTSLELEITEGVAMGDLDLTTAKLLELKEMGIDMTIDDFGTGYSSLSYLKRFPINNLKIDRSFIIGAASNRQDSGIIEAIVSMARSFKLNVTAEGVEDPEQLKYLNNLGCYRIQGFAIRKPISADDFVEWSKSLQAQKQIK